MARAAAREPQQPGGHDTRQRILAAARSLFAEHGYSGTSVRMIARTLQITDPAIHYHFPTKQDLYDALLVEPDYGELPLDMANVTRAALIEQVMHLFGWWTARPEFGQMLLREQLAHHEASLTFMATADESWATGVTAPLRTLFGRPAIELSEMLYEVMAGIFWDAILSYGRTFADVVRQEYFLARVRSVLELAIPEPDGATP